MAHAIMKRARDHAICFFMTCHLSDIELKNPASDLQGSLNTDDLAPSSNDKQLPFALPACAIGHHVDMTWRDAGAPSSCFQNASSFSRQSADIAPPAYKTPAYNQTRC